MKKTRLISFSLAILFVCLPLFTGCNIQSVDEYNAAMASAAGDSSPGSSAEASSSKGPSSGAQPEDSSAGGESSGREAPSSEKTSSGKEQGSSAGTPAPSGGQTSSTSQKQGSSNVSGKNTSSRKKADSSKEKTSSKAAVSSKKPASSKPQTKKKTVTITIRCDTILDNWDKLDKSLQNGNYVPKNGVILGVRTYEISDGDTVFDVLKKATGQAGIKMEYQGGNQFGSVFIRGINHIYEKNCGSKSGWMYKVNSSFPSKGCNTYELKDGDRISWLYTCDLGKDIGG